MHKPKSDKHAAHNARETEAATFSLNWESGAIDQCNDAAATLLGVARSALCGELWSTAICCEENADSALMLAMKARVGSALPPFLIRRADGGQIAVAGMLVPQGSAAAANLFLWPLLDEGELDISGSFGASDIVAVLGVDQLSYDQHWGVAETAQLMTGIRTGTLDIIRTRDAVALPTGSSIIILLRDVDLEGALDISRALLSHLRRLHMNPAQPAARICVGLAQMTTGRAPLSTLLAANNALLQAQCSGGKQRIRAAADDDGKLSTGRALNHNGVFCDNLATALTGLQESGEVTAISSVSPEPLVSPIEKGIEGYVGDNMEGAVDQAIFLSRLDIPVAIIGPVGTGKMYIAKVIHDESGGAPEMLVAVDCRDFRSRSEANARIAKELSGGEGKTLVFKSPHLMNSESQLKLARQISSRTLADISPPQYLPRVKLVALFPDSLEKLIRKGSLTAPLASAFAGYPIHVPPIKDRKQAVLRWAHKVLDQEGTLRGRDMKGFTPDAEQAMLLYDWPGNISEMRECIVSALEKTEKDWLTPVDLGLFKGITPDGAPYLPEPKPFLAMVETNVADDGAYTPSALETLDVALGEAVNNLLTARSIRPLGTWADDEVVLAALDRYREDIPRVAEFLHTKPRNVSRWLPKIRSRDEERNGSSLWQKPRRLLREWVRESPRLQESPLQLVQDILIAHVIKQCGAISAANRARIIGVSMPTYLKRLRDSENS
jgi:DNA-binding NtrC family response regulator